MLSLVVSLMVSFCAVRFPLDVLDEIWDLIESVFKGFLIYFGVANLLAERLQAGEETMVDLLTKMCNKILETGEWPTSWTQSLIIILPKRGRYSSARITKPYQLPK